MTLKETTKIKRKIIVNRKRENENEIHKLK